MVLPPRCAGCGAEVQRNVGLCTDCWPRLTFISAPHCRICGLPFEIRLPGDAVCGGCLAQRPVFDHARSAVVYDDVSRPLILTFKHADRLSLTPLFVSWLRTVGEPLIDTADLLVPVPLHRWRLLARRYNQAALLAQGLGKSADRPVATNLLLRTRRTPTQGRLSARQREKNVRGAFALRKECHGSKEAMQGRRVLLIDDVLTTGATVNACARTLIGGGAAAVDVLTVARVV